MDKLEQIENKIETERVQIIPCIFQDVPIQALYTNGVIGIDPRITNKRERRCILAEEYCHHIYSVGNLLYDNKQEAYARGKAYEMLVPIDALKAAVKPEKTVYEIAEELEVIEDILLSAIKYYISKGIHISPSHSF